MILRLSIIVSTVKSAIFGLSHENIEPLGLRITFYVYSSFNLVTLWVGFPAGAWGKCIFLQTISCPFYGGSCPAKPCVSRTHRWASEADQPIMWVEKASLHAHCGKTKRNCRLQCTSGCQGFRARWIKGLLQVLWRSALWAEEDSQVLGLLRDTREHTKCGTS